jgi:hypothetical protein
MRKSYESNYNRALRRAVENAKPICGNKNRVIDDVD